MSKRDPWKKLKRNPASAIIGAYATAAAMIARFEAAPAVAALVGMACLAVSARFALQCIHAFALRRAKMDPPPAYLFMSMIGLFASVGVLFGLRQDGQQIYFLLGHWTLTWLVYSSEMHYNELAADGKISYLSEARQLRWLALRSLRFLYGGKPSPVVRARLVFAVMLAAALSPALRT